MSLFWDRIIIHEFLCYHKKSRFFQLFLRPCIFFTNLRAIRDLMSASHTFQSEICSNSWYLPFLFLRGVRLFIVTTSSCFTGIFFLHHCSRHPPLFLLQRTGDYHWRWCGRQYITDRICRCHFHAGIMRKLLCVIFKIPDILHLFQMFVSWYGFRSVDCPSASRINMIFRILPESGGYANSKIWIILPEFTGILNPAGDGTSDSSRILCPYITEFYPKILLIVEHSGRFALPSVFSLDEMFASDIYCYPFLNNRIIDLTQLIRESDPCNRIRIDLKQF